MDKDTEQSSKLEQLGQTLDSFKPSLFNLHPTDPETPYRGYPLKQVTPSEFVIQHQRYRVVFDYREGLNFDSLAQRFDDVLIKYDYIVGDWGFEQLRLRGFYRQYQRQANHDQVIDYLQDYLCEYCNPNCPYFIIEKVTKQKGNTKARKNTRRRRGASHVEPVKKEFKIRTLHES